MRNLLLIVPLVVLLGAAQVDLEGVQAKDLSTLRIIDIQQCDQPRESFFRAFQVVEDLGPYLVVDPATSDLAAMEKWGLSSTMVSLTDPDETCYIVSLKGKPEVTAGEVLFLGEEIALVAANAAEAMALERHVPHYGLEKGLRPLNLDTMPAPAIFKAPKTTRAADTRIQAMVSQVSAANLQSLVQDMQDMGERRADSGGFVAETYLVNSFNAIANLTVTTQEFNPTYSDNVIAELPGVVDPSIIYVVGGHYDSIASGSAAPGADDNASGIAGVREIARILSQYQFKYTLRFCSFGAEELGLFGSEAYCDYLVNQGHNVQAMINLDMTAYRQAGDPRDVGFITNYSSSSLISFMSDQIQTYVPTLGITQGSLSGGSSDHQSFTEHGFTACFPFEDIDNYSPYIHSANDVIGTSANDFTLSRMITQATLASLATLAGPLDLDIQHSALADTTDSSGPYPVTAEITSLIGNTVSSATLYYDLGSGYLFAPMVPSNAPDGFIGSIPGLPGSGVVKYYIEAVDSQGFSERLPGGLNAESYEFSVGYFTDVFADDFEINDNGWTHAGTGQDDWMRDVPSGNGGYDPGFAASGAKIWGNDLGPSGYNGNYAANVDNYLESPNINCSGQTDVVLRYRRWLSVEDRQFDQAKILVNGTQVFINPLGSDFVDTQWVLHEIDISAIADNNPNVKVRFSLATDGDVEFGGWNIDDFHVGTKNDGDLDSLAESEVYFQAAAGGSIDFSLDAGVAHAGRTYLILGSFSGTNPGIPLPGGLATLPVNWDNVTDLILGKLNSPTFANFLGALDLQGRATAQFSSASISTAHAGKTISFAYCLEGLPWDFASNPVNIEIVP